jgi:hypothetical protein
MCFDKSAPLFNGACSLNDMQVSEKPIGSEVKKVMERRPQKLDDVDGMLRQQFSPSAFVNSQLFWNRLDCGSPSAYLADKFDNTISLGVRAVCNGRKD